MSACISHHGEYSSHEPGDDFRCQLCGVLDEDALIERVKRAEAVIAEVKAEAWDEGYGTGWVDGEQAAHGGEALEPVNPYRAEAARLREGSTP